MAFPIGTPRPSHLRKVEAGMALSPEARQERAADMVALRAQGWSLSRIGHKYNLSYERARQIIQQRQGGRTS